MRIDPRGEKATLVLEDGAEIRLDAETVLREGLRTGDPVDAQLRSVLEEAGLRWSTREAALRLLAHRARSRRELETRLRRKDFPGRLIREVADELTHLGYLDDAAFARAWVADRLRLRPRGRRALAAELRKKGVAGALIEAALDDAFREEGASELQIARDLADGWLRRQPAGVARDLLSDERAPEAEKARRRFQGFMARRGIPGGVTFRVLEELRRRED
jgi:regulatory protein